MMSPSSPWGWDDVRVVGDIVLGTLLASAIRLIITKAFVEPAAVWLGQTGWRRLDNALGGWLPDWFPQSSPEDVDRLECASPNRRN